MWKKRRPSVPPPRAPLPPVSYRRLPEPVPYDDLVESKDPFPPPDPTRGRDTERDFLLRYAGLL